MSVWGTWMSRLGAILGTVVLSLFVPAVAWAASAPGSVVLEAARRPRSGFGFLGALCCLVVVAGVVALILLLTRGRRSGRR